MNKLDKIRDLHNFFLKRFRPKKPVVLRISKLNDYGSYYYNGAKHYISLDKRGNYETMISGLVHEWGHVLQTNKQSLNDHSNHWGAKFSKVYRIYLEWLDTI